MNPLENALADMRSRRAQYIDEYRELLSIPSVSTLPEHAADVRRAAEWLAAQLRDAGMPRVEIYDTPGHPILFAESPKMPGKPTILVYGHYDVQPVDPLNEWTSPPFAGEMVDEYIIARGASDMKGQIFAQIKAMQALAGQGPLPVNLKYLLEGEEEIGSPNLPAFIERHQEALQCDVVLNCDAGIHAPEVPAITYSLRGLAYFELMVQGPGKDLHSGLFGGSIRNPIHVLCELIAAMHDGQGRVTIPGFYDRVRDLDPEERALMAQVPYTDEDWLRMTGAKDLYGESGYNTVERVGARPTLDVNGIYGGFTGEGAKTVLPARATAKLSMRLVPHQRSEEIEAMLRAYLGQHMPPEMTWTLHEHSHGPGAIMDRKSPYMQSAAAALSAVFGKAPLFKREGGSVPVVGLLQEKLGVDSIMLGFALPDDGIHGPNERQYLPNIFRGMEVYARFIDLLGNA